MTELYAGATIRLSWHRIVSVTDCALCHKLMIRVDKDKLNEDDIALIDTLGLRLAAPNTRRDICTTCEEEKRQSKLKTKESKEVGLQSESEEE